MKYIVYHGRTVKDPTFSLDYVGKTGWDQYGPGFYFTDVEEEAARFSESGGSVIKASIEINNPLTDNEDITEEQVTFMIDNAPSVTESIIKMKNLEEGSDEYLEAFYETPLSDYGETFHSARVSAIDNYSGSLRDTMEYIWRDFYKYDSDVYLKNLLKLGYDGVIIPSEATIYVVFSPNQIKVLDVRLVESISITMRNFIESFKRDTNKSLVESIIDGFDIIFENERVGGKSLAEYNRYKYLNNVTIYRARSVDSDYFMSDDYVTLSPKFAIDHAESTHVYTDEPQIVIRAKVSPKYVVDALNPGEYFYKGDTIKGDVAYISKGDSYEGIIPDISKTKLQFPIDVSLLESSNMNNNITLYRGLEDKYDPNYDLDKTDAPIGYSTWTDNIELARQYAGETGYVYKIELPISELGQEYIDNEGERFLFFDNEKKAGLNNVSGKEYLVYQYHDMFNPSSISLIESNDQISGGLADHMSIADIADNHDVSVDLIISELEMGIKVEMEHTDDPVKATEIAMDHLVEIPDYYTRLHKMENDSIMESNNPMRPPRPKLDISNSSSRTRMMFGILNAYQALSARNKVRFMNKYVPKGINIAIYSLDTLDNNTLIRMKDNLMDIRDEEHDYDNSLKNERNKNRDRKRYERAMDENDKLMKKEMTAASEQAMKEQQDILDQRINSGEIDADEVERMREDGEIDDNNQIIHINAPDKTIVGGVKKIGKGLKELKNSFTRKK